jgi:protein-S-isoprenylcysteine O-methyltransferase Ste14
MRDNPSLRPQLMLGLLKALLLVALPLFLAAGTLAWPAAWIFVALFMAGTVALSLWLQRHDPALLAERLKGVYQEGQPRWDKGLITGAVCLWPAWLVIIGLDHRFGWSEVPLPIVPLGYAAYLVGNALLFLVFRANTFLAPVVRLQGERHHRLVSSGPYAIVRHPMYSGALLLFFAVPLMLGSGWGLVAALPLSAVLVVRTMLEDATLARALEGYDEYRRRVRWRLVPGIW